MKHLKTFKLFESNIDNPPLEGTALFHDLNDMLLELEDIGYNTEVTDMSNNDEHAIGIQICKRDDRGISSFKMTDDIKDSLFRLRDFMSGWKMIINSNHNYLYLFDDNRLVGAFGTPNPNWPTFTKLDIIFSKKIDVNEGFFSNMKDKFKKLIKPEEPAKIDTKEFEYTLDDCLIDLKDNGFIIDIKKTQTRMKPSRYKGQMLDMRDYESLVYFLQIKKPEEVVRHERTFAFYGGAGYDVPVYENPIFKFGEIKDTLLFTMDTIKSMYGIDIFSYRPNIENKDNDEEYSIFEIEFEIPVDMIKENLSYDVDDIKNNIKDIFIDLDLFETSVVDFKRDKGEMVFNAMLKKLKKFQESYLYKNSFKKEPCQNITEIVHVRITEIWNAYSPPIKFKYETVKEDVERCIEYMESDGWWYVLEPTWEGSIGIEYNTNTVHEFSDRDLISLNILFYK